jgi:hypothetical protein
MGVLQTRDYRRLREIRDGNGPTRPGHIAYWRRNNENPALKQMLELLQERFALPAARAHQHVACRHLGRCHHRSMPGGIESR